MIIMAIRGNISQTINRNINIYICIHMDIVESDMFLIFSCSSIFNMFIFDVPTMFSKSLGCPTSLFNVVPMKNTFIYRGPHTRMNLDLSTSLTGFLTGTLCSNYIKSQWQMYQSAKTWRLGEVWGLLHFITSWRCEISLCKSEKIHFAQKKKRWLAS